MRKGRRLAVDVGKARIGLAISDQEGIIASPLATVKRNLESIADTLTAVHGEIDDFVFLEIYVGLPIGLNGNSTPSTADALLVGEALGSELGLAVRYIDERLTSVSAAANLRLAGKNSKNSRSVIDQEAAAIILEQALQAEKQLGHSPGRSYSDLLEAGLVSS
ncbi:MAG: Holliday junction resolvase RuvX [Micrococcales bacterium]